MKTHLVWLFTWRYYADAGRGNRWGGKREHLLLTANTIDNPHSPVREAYRAMWNVTSQVLAHSHHYCDCDGKNFLVNWLNEYRTKPQISQNKCSNTLKEVPTLGRHRNQQKLMQHASKERRRSIYKYSGSAPKDHSLEHVLCPTLLTLPCYKPLFAGC